jgi:hypothetical protein
MVTGPVTPLSPLSFPKSGDETASLQIRVQSAGTLSLDVAADVVVVRSDNAIVLVLQSGLETVDPAELTKLVPTAVSRVDKEVAAA